MKLGKNQAQDSHSALRLESHKMDLILPELNHNTSKACLPAKLTWDQEPSY